MISGMNRDTIDDLLADWSKQRPDLDSTPMGVVLRIQALAKKCSDQLAKRLRELGLQWWQYDVLSSLRRQGEPYMLPASELAEAAQLTSGAMTNRIDRLEQAGLVQRQEDPGDRRVVLIRLTDEGLQRVEGATAVRFDAAASALRGLDAAQRGALTELLRLALLNCEDADEKR